MTLESTDHNVPEKTAVHRWLINKMFESVPFDKSQRVLDIHVGKGNYTIELATKVMSVEAFHTEETSLSDLKKAIKKQKIKNINVHPAVASYDQLPFEKETLDLVSCRTAIHHFADFASALKEIHRVLKPDGILSINDPIVSNAAKGVWKPIVRMLQSDHNCFLTYFELLELLHDAGFYAEKIVPYKAPRDLAEYVSVATSPDLAETIRNVILDTEILKRELRAKNLQTSDELSILRQYGIQNPKPGWRLWYNLVEVIARKKTAGGTQEDVVNTPRTQEVYDGEVKKQKEVARVVSHAFELIAPYLHPDDIVLDVACGQGSGTVLLADKVGEVHAIDPRESAVKGVRNLMKGQKNTKIYDPVLANRAFPFSDEKFDAATSLLGTALYPDFKFLLNEVGRVLKQGGRYVVLCAVFSEQIRPIWLTLARLAFQPITFYETFSDIIEAFDCSSLKIEAMRPHYGERYLSEFLKKIADPGVKKRFWSNIEQNPTLMKEMRFRYSEEEKDWVFFFNTLEILAIKESS